MVVRKVSIRTPKRVRVGTQIEGEVAALERELAKKKKILDAVRLLESSGMVVVPNAPSVRRGRFSGKATPVRPVKKPVIAKAARNIAAREYGRLTWTDAMWRVMEEQTDGISYGALLAELVKGELGKNRSKGDKGFYQAIRRLVASGDLVKIGGLLYTNSLVASLRERGDDLPEAPRGNGRGGSRHIIMAVLSDHPRGLTGQQIKEMAAKYANAPNSLRSDSHYIYNVLGQMKKDGQITHEGNIYRMGTAPSETRAVH
jgi:hypothetical protein